MSKLHFVIAFLAVGLFGCEQTEPKPFLDTEKVFSGFSCPDGLPDTDRKKILECPLHESVLVDAAAGAFDQTLTGQVELRRLFEIYKTSIDNSYFEFRDEHLVGNRAADAALSIFATLLPIAGVTGNVSGTDLGAAALGAEVLGDVRRVQYGTQALPLLVQKMDSDREETSKAIAGRLAGTSFVVSDLVLAMHSYYRAGTLAHASNRLGEIAQQGKSALN